MIYLVVLAITVVWGWIARDEWRAFVWRVIVFPLAATLGSYLLALLIVAFYAGARR